MNIAPPVPGPGPQRIWPPCASTIYRQIWFGDVTALLPTGFAPDYRPRMRALSTEELGQLLALLSPARAAQVSFIVATSACWSESVKARRGDVELESGWVHGTLLALWPSLGGHFIETAFLDVMRPRLPRAPPVQATARLGCWLAGGALLGVAMIATAGVLPVAAPPWSWWWIGAPLFLGLELAVHLMLALRGRPNFYRGDD